MIMIKPKAIASMNQQLAKYIEERKFSILLEEGDYEDFPHKLEIIDIIVEPVSFKISPEYMSNGMELYYYQLHFKGYGFLNVFDKTSDIEPFFGDFECYFENGEELIVIKKPKENEANFTELETYMLLIDISYMLSEQQTHEFIMFHRESVETLKYQVISDITKYYEIENEALSIDFEGSNVKIWFDEKEVPLLLHAGNLSKIR